MKNVTINAKLLDHYRFLNVKGYVQQFSNFHKDENGTPVLNQKTVRILMARKSDPYILFFKNQPKFQQMNLLQRGGKRKKVIDKNSINTNLKALYSSRLPISTGKYNDLMKQCELCIFPDDYHEEYNQLLNRNKKETFRCVEESRTVYMHCFSQNYSCLKKYHVSQFFDNALKFKIVFHDSHVLNLLHKQYELFKKELYLQNKQCKSATN